MRSTKTRVFVIVGFPANNFGSQEPGTNEEIKTSCSRKYNVTIPLYSKLPVKGDDQTPLYQDLTKQTDPSIAGEIKWNFTKFLVDRNGHVVQRFESAVTPDSSEVVSAVEKATEAAIDGRSRGRATICARPHPPSLRKSILDISIPPTTRMNRGSKCRYH
jgi:glutathione peroxidase-family protein